MLSSIFFQSLTCGYGASKGRRYILSTGRCLNFYLGLAQGSLFIDIPASHIDVLRKECQKKKRKAKDVLHDFS